MRIYKFLLVTAIAGLSSIIVTPALAQDNDNITATTLSPMTPLIATNKTVTPIVPTHSRALVRATFVASLAVDSVYPSSNTASTAPKFQRAIRQGLAQMIKDKTAIGLNDAQAPFISRVNMQTVNMSLSGPKSVIANDAKIVDYDYNWELNNRGPL